MASGLADLMSNHLSTASILFDKHEVRGFVRRDEEQRVVRLHFTLQGTRAVAKAPKPAREVVPDVLSSVPTATLTALENGLDTLIVRFKERGKHATAKPLDDI